jgi:hypothetical protein
MDLSRRLFEVSIAVMFANGAMAQGPDKVTRPTVVAPAQANISVPLGGSVAVTVAQLNQVLPLDLSKASLFLAGHKVAGAKATSLDLEADSGRIAFDLPTEIADGALLLHMRRNEPMELSVGLKDDQPIPTKFTIRLEEPAKVIAASTDAKSARFDRPIVVRVAGLNRWIEDQKTVDAAMRDDAHIRLFLAEHELIGVRPKVTEAADGTSQLSFDPSNRTVPPERKEEDRAGWVNAVSILRRDDGIPATIGFEKSSRLMPSTVTIKVALYSPSIWFALALIPLLAIATIYLGQRSDLVREAELDDLPAGKRSCYSLASCQMAAWFFLVITAYIYITFTYGTPPPITPTILTLIGISAGTGLAAAVIDNSQRNDRIKQVVDLKTQSESLTRRIADLKQMLLAAAPVVQPVAGGAAAAPALDPSTSPAAVNSLQQELQNKTAEIAGVQARLANLPPPPPPRVSSGFIKDLLREGSSVSFHRFQIAIWTIVLGIIFVRSVWHDLSMPEFDQTLLGLMGISSGTYLGFKIPDKPMSSPDGK